jgi:hypothetical protein
MSARPILFYYRPSPILALQAVITDDLFGRHLPAFVGPESGPRRPMLERDEVRFVCILSLPNSLRIFGREVLENLADGEAYGFDASGGGLSQEMLELGEDLLDGRLSNRVALDPPS